MKKWYRIYEILDNQPVLTDDSIGNWFDTTEWAESMIASKLRSYPGKSYTILTVYEKTEN